MKNIDKETEEKHRAKMAKRKAVQDAEVAGKTVAEGGQTLDGSTLLEGWQPDDFVLRPENTPPHLTGQP